MLRFPILTASLAVLLGGCGGGGGGADADPAAPTVVLDVAPASVVSGSSALLTWNATDATDCAASAGWAGVRLASGSESTGALTVAKSYTLTCTGPGGVAADTIMVAVTALPVPTVSLTVTPQTIASGGTATLNWSSTDTTACTASGSWSGSKSIAGSQGTGVLGGNASYTLTCTGAGGSATKTASVTVTPVVGAPTINLAANPSNVLSGSAANLSWTTANAASCTASGGWTGNRATSGATGTGNLSSTTGFTLACTGPGGSSSQTVTVTVTPPAPTVTLSANPTSVASGTSSTLTWSTTNATACTASGGWSGSKATSGTASTGAVASTRTFSLTCTGAGGTGGQSTSVTVVPTPIVTLSANPTSVASGGSSTLTWSTSNATACTASGGWSGGKAMSGTASTGALASTTTFTLTCSGAGGSASDSASVTITGGGSSPFPVHVEAGKRYLITAQGQPFLMNGDTPWCLITQLTREEADQYLEDRRVKGFNTVMIELIEKKFSTNPPYNVYGDAPFLTAGDFSTPNEAYFSHAEYIIAKAREKGMLVLLTPAYMGFGGGPNGWYDEMEAAGTTELRNYGRYLATRFQDYDNILWVHGGDYNPTERLLLRSIVDGILDIDATPLHSFHGSRGTAALDWLGASETWLDVNDIYTAVTMDNVISEAQGEYNRSTMPFFLIEGAYEGEAANGTQTRLQAWQTVLSGGTGHLMGQKSVWKFDPIWPTRLDTEGASTLIHLRTLLESYDWWTLAPDFGNSFLTNGIGSGASRAPAAIASNGSFAIIYVPDLRTITVDLADMAGPQVRARWYDPSSGTFTTVAGSPFATASRSFTQTVDNSRGREDWVLVLDSVP
ncbi:MAG: DUF4038 domain-containing protein [Gammaproteobacteria bacterium]